MRRLWAALLLLPLCVLADERILSFHSDIVVDRDGQIEVTETIRVRAEGDRIRRGIYRDMPTRYRDAFNNEHEVDIQPLALLRNERAESFHTRILDDGVRTYFGRSL